MTEEEDILNTSSNVRAIYGGGYVSSITDDIDHIQIASKGNATDYGNLSVTRFGWNNVK